MKIFCHRGKYGCTDIGQDFLKEDDVKGQNLIFLEPENSEASIRAAFESGFYAETDVVMTKDKKLIATHTNDLYLHSKDAKKGDYASNMTFENIMKMKTGMGGKTSNFLTYEKLIELLEEYPNAIINIEIKGTIEPENSLPEPQNPTLVEQLVKLTPTHLFSRIIWSSFATSNLVKIKSLKNNANIAQLFAISNVDKRPIYPNTDDMYYAFTIPNIKTVISKINMNAFHVVISSLTKESLDFCNEHKIAIRTWAFMERNPKKNELAKQDILNLVSLSKQYTDVEIDIITDYADEVIKLI